MRALLTGLGLIALASPAFANVLLVPEPGTLSLVGVAAAIGVGLALRGRK